jgi:hypothetical protein
VVALGADLVEGEGTLVLGPVDVRERGRVRDDEPGVGRLADDFGDQRGKPVVAADPAPTRRPSRRAATLDVVAISCSSPTRNFMASFCSNA